MWERASGPASVVALAPQAADQGNTGVLRALPDAGAGRARRAERPPPTAGVAGDRICLR
jgi:hypothetical protein